MAAGKYDTRFAILRYTRTTDSEYGTLDKDHLPDVDVWGSLNSISATKLLAYGAMGLRVDSQIVLRNFPPLDIKDRLQVKGDDSTVFVINGISYNDDETVIVCHQETNRGQ